METDSIETYFEQNATDGVLSDAAMAKLLTGDMGDTAAVAEAGEKPDPAPVKEDQLEKQPAAEQPEGDGKPDEATATGDGEEGHPIVLAKNGKNTIPYDKLVEARNEAKAAKEANQTLMQEMESLKEQIANLNAEKPQPQQDHEQKPDSIDVNQLEREWHEAIIDDNTDKAIEIRGKINAELKRQALQEASEKIQADKESEQHQQAQLSAQDALENAAAEVAKDYPELDSSSDSANLDKVTEVVEYRDFLVSSKGMQPHEALKQAAKRIMGYPVQKLAEGDTSAPKDQPQKVEPKVKERTPTTMSDIPAGTQVHTDEAEALTQMSSTALIGKFMNMDPAKIEQMVSRVV